MPSSLTLQATHINPLEWFWVLGALAIPAGVTAVLLLRGRAQPGPLPVRLFARAGDSLERAAGLPAWAAAGVLLQIWAMLTAGIGLFWDVAWHIDLGRDTELFTPPHVMVLTGLFGFVAAGAVSVVFATLSGATSGWRVGRLRIPHGAGALLVLGATASIGFPLDELWHATYGIDVTMWSPTHLMMIGAGAVSPFAGWILLREAGRPVLRPRARLGFDLALGISCLLALSVLQLEFDDGVPQWQALFQPVLIAVSATLPLVVVRTVAGRGAALFSALVFIVLRATAGLIVGPLLGHVMAHFPLYIGIALCVEAGFLINRRSLWAAALVAGGLSATAGMASEWGWSHLFGREPWQPSLLGSMWVPALGAVGAAVLGAAFGAALRGERLGAPRFAPLAAAAAVLVAIVVPLPRSGLAVSATVITSPAGPAQLAVDRYGQASIFRMVRVEVDVPPAESGVLRSSDWFWVNSWQGGGRRGQALTELAPGRWVAAQPVPTGAAWKTIILLAHNDIVAALPVALPADPAVGIPAIPLASSRTEDFQPASRYLMQEAHAGAAWPAVLAYAAWSVMVAAWLILIAGGARRLAGATPRRASGRVAGRRTEGVAALVHPSR